MMTTFIMGKFWTLKGSSFSAGLLAPFPRAGRSLILRKVMRISLQVYHALGSREFLVVFLSAPLPCLLSSWGHACEIVLHWLSKDCITGMPPLTVLCRVFYKLKVPGNCASNKSIHTIFLTAFVHLAPPGHILVILAIVWTFSLLLYLLRWL